MKDKRLKIIVAYEPRWAIGTSRNCPPADALAMIQFIRQKSAQILGSRLRKYPISNIQYRPQVLYGGSVDGKNIFDYLQYKEIDGALVGGASLLAAEFGEMVKICDSVNISK
jgi:triosephosphate isomerase